MKMIRNEEDDIKQSRLSDCDYVMNGNRSRPYSTLCQEIDLPSIWH